MKVTFIAADLSANSLLRPYLLAVAIKERHDVKIVGPLLGKAIWPPLADQEEIEIDPVRLGKLPMGYLRMAGLFKLIDGDIIFACKPLFSSLGIGIICKLLKRKALVLDVDDWEKGLAKENFLRRSATGKMRGILYSMLFPLNRDAYINAWLSEKLVPLADAVTVSNHFLQSIYGGTLVYHGRVSRELCHEHREREFSREDLGVIEGQYIVMFLGTPRRHKGLEVLIEAVKALEREDVILMIVGMISNDGYCRELREKGERILGSNFVPLETQPIDRVGELLELADLVVIPQTAGPASMGQIPAKVFDAMAAAKPIIATSCGDLPLVLNGCGVLVEPGDIEELSRQILRLIEDPEEAERLGREAFARWSEVYCREEITDSLDSLLLKTVEEREVKQGIRRLRNWRSG
ncbi:MAG: glycosyltransferase [Actinobacteria bacterium]|nr:glycosyltransferase [Actinomycetota bacterium]